jgi:hypothetical protein
MGSLILALGALVFVSDKDLVKCPDSLPTLNSAHFASEVFKLPKHACWFNSGTGEYIVTIYGSQRADQQ